LQKLQPWFELVAAGTASPFAIAESKAKMLSRLMRYGIGATRQSPVSKEAAASRVLHSLLQKTDRTR